MRWTDQLESAHRASQLPGLSDAVVRTFDAPEAMEAQFHEIHAKSALNRVPGATRLPFGWTVNPYRGCLHSCSYCMSGDTPILMADGRTKLLADLHTGDEIYGTRVVGRHRRYVRTTVLDHWSSVKPALRTTLGDGTELVTSGDHRFLTERGWKHVAGSMSGAKQRPYLTTNNSLIGTGAFAAPPVESRSYRRGYLCGLVRGDGNLATDRYERPGRAHGDVHRFRMAAADTEALDRCERLLELEGVRTRPFMFAVAPDRRRAIHAIRSQAQAHVELITELIRWPLDPENDWRKGFLAGIFDAEGSCAVNGGELRISNTDTAILAWTEACLRHFGFDVVVEDPGKPNRLRVVRVRGGLREQLRFFHLTNPAITRKRDLGGLALTSDADLRVVSIDPLGTAMRLYDITTGTGDFIANGVISHNCFARPTHEYLGLNAGRDFEKQIVVKVNAPEVLRVELRRPSWRFEHVALGTNTDPYQWVERRYGLTRSILEVLRDARNPCSVLTKSPLLLRDMDVFKELLEVTEFFACLSIPTLDEKAWRATEPATPHPRKRIEAVAKLNAAGIPTGVLVAPLMPGINDAPEQVAAVVEACKDAGATRIGGTSLYLRGSTKDVFMGYLRGARPDLVSMYERLYGGKRAYLSAPDKRRVEAPLRRLASEYVPELADRFQQGAAPQDPPPRLAGAAALVDVPGGSDRDRARPLEVARGGPPSGAERRFRGFAIAEEGRPPHFASPRGAPRRPADDSAANGDVAPEAPQDPLRAAEARRRAPVQDVLF